MPARSVARPNPRRKASPRTQPEIKTGTSDGIKGFTKYPYEYDHLVTGNKLSGLLQANLVYVISRNTWGNAKRPEWAKLSLTALAKLTGGVERKSVAIALADLIRRGIVAARDRKGCAATAAKMYRLTPEKWRRAKPYVPPTPAEEAEAELEVTAEDSAETADPAAAESQERTVAPGRQSRPQPVSISVKGSETPIAIRVVYHSRFDEPLSFRTQPGANGNLSVTVSRPDEQKAKRCSPAQPQSFPVSSPSTEENKRLTEYRVFISQLVLNLWGKTADEQLIAAVLKAAGAAPIRLFEHIVFLRFKNRSDASRFHSAGLLPSLAQDARQAYLAMQTKENNNPQAPEKRPASPAEPLDMARRWDRIRGTLKAKLSPTVYANWFEYTRQIEERRDATVVSVATEDQAKFMEDEFTSLIKAACLQLGEPTVIFWRSEA
jgi:hypothetical protein